MCGIVAIHAPGDSWTPAQLESATAAIAHRGPDEHGVWMDQRAGIGLGHRRLSVVGVEDGSQPLSSEDGSVRAVVNGEFYGYANIRDMLVGKGHVFATRSDSEILVHLYEEYGLFLFRFLRGEFAFILWDGVRDHVVAARDRFGIKPLNYARMGNGLGFASETKALFAMGLRPCWSATSVRHVMSHQYLPPEATMFDGVRQVPPGYCLVSKRGQTENSPYWVVPSRSDAGHVGDAEHVRELLQDAVRVRLEADMAPAFALSGGVDSAAVVALAASATNRRMDCFAVRFEGPGYDEGADAGKAADATCARLIEVPVRQEDLVEHLEAAVRQAESPAINGQLVGKYLLSRAIRDHGFKSALSGEGADEAFLGYAHLHRDYLQAKGLPALASPAAEVGIMLPSAGVQSELPSFLAAKLSFSEVSGPLCRGPLPGRESLSDALRQVRDLNRAHDWRPGVGLTSLYWGRLALSGYILKVLGDGMEMAHSVEGRLPFLDHALFEYVSNCRTDAMLSRTRTKVLLRESLRGVIPDALRLRPKHPFIAPPLVRGANHRVATYVRDMVRDGSLSDIPLLDRDRVIAWVDGLFASPDSYQPQYEPVLMLILSLVCLQRSYRMGDSR